MTIQVCLLLSDCLIDCTMAELEERICATPNPKLPIFTAEGSDDATWPVELSRVAGLARRCCCAEPEERLRAAELRAHIISMPEA